MRRTEALQGVRMAMFLNLLQLWEQAELNQEAAAELLGVDVRTFRPRDAPLSTAELRRRQRRRMARATCARRVIRAMCPSDSGWP